MRRFIYEKSVSYQGYLVIPFELGTADNQIIYSYALLSELGYKGKFHQATNPAGIYCDSMEGILDVAKEHLAKYSDIVTATDYFKIRYTYLNNLIIVCNVGGKYFYDHYKPESLNNIAAAKIFQSEYECINWIKQGLDNATID